MNILITRPLIDCEDLMGKLFSLGHKIIHIPTLKISPLKNSFNDKKKYKAFIFTSANAVRNFNVRDTDKSKLCFCVGSITEKILRKSGFTNTFSAGGTVIALKNLIVNSEKLDNNSSLAYFCGDNLTTELSNELILEGFKVDKIINYTSKKITDLNEESKKIVTKHPPDLIFVYSVRSAQSFVEISKNHGLHPLMTASKVMCISKSVLDVFKKFGWKNLDLFEPGDELKKLK